MVYRPQIDAIRCAKLALQRELGGVLEGLSAYFCKHPPRQFTDDKAYQMTENFITQYPQKVREMSDYRRRQSDSARAKKKRDYTTP